MSSKTSSGQKKEAKKNYTIRAVGAFFVANWYTREQAVKHIIEFERAGKQMELLRGLDTVEYRSPV